MWLLICDQCQTAIERDIDGNLQGFTIATPCHTNFDGTHEHGDDSHFCSKACLAAWSMAYAMDT